MKILFFIGNGFDLNFGMKTKYTDFYKYYNSIQSNSKKISQLKEAIDNNIENWSDLELSLGKYTKYLRTKSDFEEVFEDIGDKLAEYLNIESKKHKLKNINELKLYKYLSFPEDSLPEADKNDIKKFTTKWINFDWKIDIISFNYTNTLEEILKYTGSPKFLLKTNSKHSTRLNRIEHIHGYINDRMVMGVNDKSQISNVIFKNNQEVLEAIVKPQCNQVQKHNIDVWCKNQINEANLICIFGSSIGETDKIWWEFIGERLKSECRLIIFEKTKSIHPRRKYKIAPYEREIRKKILSRTKLTEVEKKNIEQKIFIGINTNIFKFSDE